jgi:hypothetical protein
MFRELSPVDGLKLFAARIVSVGTAAIICLFSAACGEGGVSGSYNDLKKAYPQYTWGESRLMN